MIETIKILHGADQHVKQKDNDIEISIKANLENIVSKLIETKAEVFVFAGDLYDTPNPNEAERKLVNFFIGNILKVETLKEFVFMNGNHDIYADKNNLDLLKSNNSFDSLNKFIETLTPELSNKVTYLKLQKQYKSKVSDKLSWISYSLEDGKSNGNNINWELVDNSTYNISIFHDIVRDYVEDTKLPVRTDKLRNLPYVKDFKTDLILAGDIHKNYTKVSEGKTFIYPGSTNQVNFGEKTSIKVRKNSTIFHADTKCLKLHELNFSMDNKVNVHTVDLELDTNLSLIEIDCNSNKVTETFLADIEKFLKIAKFGIKQTIIKLKLSSNYGKHEMDIFKLVQSIGDSKTPNLKIITTYDKFSISAEELTEDLVEQDEQEDNDFVFNIDNLKLTSEKLNGLFAKTLERQLNYLQKELGDSNLVKEVSDNIQSIFSEQIDLLISAIPNFNIVLESIETNGFMGLEKNSINLLVPGIIKINGTNGIGKTTLLNMIRYIIKGVVFDGLKANQKKQNTLLIFNDKQINQNIVSVRMFAKINNTQIAMTRIASRKWKNNVTDEQKSSIEWKKYVSEVSTSLQLDVMSKDGQKIYTGEEAENLINNWFGDVASTILILNNFRILSLLNLQSDKLQQMVLDYIGIDYILLLKENLPAIKNNYNLKKPEDNIELLKLEYIRLTKLIESGYDNVNDLVELIDNTNTQLKDNNQIIENNNNQLLSLGNIPKNIEELNSEISNTELLVTNFVHKELIELPVWTEEKPVMFNYDEITKQIESNELLINNHTVNIDNLTIQKNILSESIVNELKADKIKYPLQIEECYNEQLVIYTNSLEENRKLFLEQFEELTTIFRTTSNALTEARDKKHMELVDTKNNKNNILLKIDDIDNHIESNICKECLRPLGDDFESHKEILLNQKDVLINESQQLELSINSISDNYNKIVDYKDLFDKYLEESIKNNLTYFLSLTNFEYHKQIDNLNELNKLILLYGQITIKIGNKSLSYFENHEDNNLSEMYNIINELQTKINTIDNHIEYIHKNDIDNITDISLLNIIKNINMVIIQKNNLFNETQQIKHNKEIEVNKFVDALKDYNTRYELHVESLNIINSDNVEINKHNSSIDNLKNLILTCKLKLSDNYTLLSDYENLINVNKQRKLDSESFTENINSLNISLSNLKTELLTAHNDITNVNEKLRLWTEYKRNTLIYNIYDNLINNDFPDIIFDYYRQYLNSSLNVLLQDMNFKLYWDKTGDLYMVEINQGHTTYRPVQLVSGMQTSFLGLSLIYTIHMLNVKNNISHIFIDELSGQFNSGKELTEKEDIVDYQEQFVLLINKFKEKSIWIIDHHIENMFETQTLEVIKGEKGNKYIIL